MFLPNKIIIIIIKLNYPPKDVGQATHGFYCIWFRRVVHMVLKLCERPPKNPWFYCTWFRRALQMVFKPCIRILIQPMVLFYIV